MSFSLFDSFITTYRPARVTRDDVTASTPAGFSAAGYTEFMSNYASLPVADGLYRVHELERIVAWHIFAEIGPEEWYEILIDAFTSELLLRHNLYVDQAQGTVYTGASDKGARQLVSFAGDTVINTAAGWMGTSTVTTGSNVEAYLDTNADNAPDNNHTTGLSVGHASSATQDFTFPLVAGPPFHDETAISAKPDKLKS